MLVSLYASREEAPHSRVGILWGLIQLAKWF
jgi:hypothetical protein